MLIVCGNKEKQQPLVKADQLETVRAHIQGWLDHISVDSLIVSSEDFKVNILDKWDEKSTQYQIVSVRWPEHFDTVGHIPNAINIPWVEIVKEENLARLEKNKTIVTYCYYGQGSMISCTMLNLLGYKCRSLGFGMMGWNLDALVKEPWDKQGNYDIDTSAYEAINDYELPQLNVESGTAEQIVLEMSRKYLGGEGSPVIYDQAVNEIVNDWENKKSKYQIIDVREESEYKIGHIPYAINIPWCHSAEIDYLKKIDPDKTIIVYCSTGRLGQLVSTVLNILGYKAVAIRFGMMDWNSSYVDESVQLLDDKDYEITTSK